MEMTSAPSWGYGVRSHRLSPDLVLASTCNTAFIDGAKSMPMEGVPSETRITDAKKNDVTERLENAKMLGRRRSQRLRGSTFTIASILAFGACWELGSNYISWMRLGGGLAGTDVYSWNYFFVVLGELLASLLYPLSLLPTDTRIIPLSTMILFLPSDLVLIVVTSLHARDTLRSASADNCAVIDFNTPCWYTGMLGICKALDVPYFVLCGLWVLQSLLRQESHDVLMVKVRRSIAFVHLGLALNSVARIFGPLTAGAFGIALKLAFLTMAHVIVGIILIRARYIRRVQSWLMSRGEAATAAAGISELLGGRDSEDVLATARGSFLYVRADRVLREDMADNKPNPSLGILAEKGKLGLIDAFVSHSWHDDAETKWMALQEWREDFKRRTGREPKFWIDKYCIDQNRVNDSLSCLPVYLSGCKKLLIFCGKTYLKRLWCLVEIFVFLEMGGVLDDLDVILLEKEQRLGVVQTTSGRLLAANSKEGRRAKKSVVNSLKQFDPREARCVSDFDTERLHKVIEATGYDSMTELVSNVFVNSGADQALLVPGWDSYE